MNNNDAINTLREIKDIMQKSSRFQTISGVSIIVIGIYASIVALGAWILLGQHEPFSWLPEWCGNLLINTPSRTWLAIICAIALVAISFGTVFLMSYNKTKRVNQRFTFDHTVRRSLTAFFVPAVTGGLVCLALLMQGHYGLTSTFMLVFYGLALINCSHFTTSDIALLGSRLRPAAPRHHRLLRGQIWHPLLVPRLRPVAHHLRHLLHPQKSANCRW